MKNVVVRRAVEVDAIPLVADMREADADELAASTDLDPIEVIVAGVRQSEESWACYIDDRLMAVWGVSSMDDERRGWGWLLTTNVAEENHKVFWKLSRWVFTDLLDRWASLENYIDARHTAALRWGERLGFQFDKPTIRGVAQIPTKRFVITKEALHV